MSYNFLSYEGEVVSSPRCLYDSNIGFEADFSKDGEVDGWNYFDGIHTYGCWNNFLFGTLYGDYAIIGRQNIFRPVAAENFYTVRIVMKLNMLERMGSQTIPVHGRIMWRTLANTTWSSDKSYDFEIYNDTEWHTYFINMAEAQWWQGDINDLRVYPIAHDGRDGDEFYIRAIEIISVDSYKCLNVSCDYYTRYEHNCPGIGERGYCRSKALPAYVFEGTTYGYSESKLYSIEKGVNDTLYVNINGYGYENIIIEPFQNYNGLHVARLIAKEISKLDVGGYAECTVSYSEMGEFIIYSGVYANDSTVLIGDSPLAIHLNFYDSHGKDISTKYTGSYPASGFLPLSSFKIKTHQIYSLLDANDKTEFYFNPFIYNVEGGRRDWLSSGLGTPSKDVRAGEGDESGLVNRYYDQINNAGQTIIDFTHPINASGRITKIYAGITLDQFGAGGWEQRGTLDANRKNSQLANAKIMFFRPLKDGNFKVLPIELDINNRLIEAGKLYSAIQEYVDIDCDIFLNKGDLIGVYNANIYRSKSVSGSEVDALYYQVPGKASGIVEVRQPSGQGSAGLLLYARSNQIQNRLILNIDLGHRVNVVDVDIIGKTEETDLIYNVARCLDIDWAVDLFGEDHTTGYIVRYRPLLKAYYNHPNIYYGKECLNDGIKTAPDGLAADSFSVEYGNSYSSWEAAVHKKNGGRGVIVQGSKYFFVNGDSEWLGVYLQAGRPSPFAVQDFEEDPIAFTLLFPLGKDKPIKKTTIYFKERYNFRSFALSVFRGDYYTEGDADDHRFELLHDRIDGTNTPWELITLDGLDFTPEDTQRWSDFNLYLAKNPCVGQPIIQITAVTDFAFDGALGGGSLASYFDQLGGLQYTSQGNIVNNDQYIQATKTDWTTLTLQWPTIWAKGFRLYCTNHQSTKICEFEVFCVVQNVKSSMGGSVDIMHSTYGDYWWPSVNKEINNGVSAFIGDTPQYMDVTIKPITEINLSDIIINVSYKDVFMGDKGCQHIFLPEEAKRGEENLPQVINFKNIYDRPYDLYVDIATDELLDEGMVFCSIMNDEESITNPLIGADAYYKKHADFPILNYQKNVAINCPVYKLNNLVEGAQAWYTYDREYSWRYWGQITDGKNINFSNLPNASITTINLPILKRSQWWKIGFQDPRIVMTVREIQVYYNGEEITDIEFYHQKNQDAITTGNTDTAPHLKNKIVEGSYYVLSGNNYIGFKLPASQKIDKIILYNDRLTEYELSHDKAGIDSSTALCIHGTGDTYQTTPLVDVSYYEHDVTVVGSGIYCDEEYEFTSYDFVQDFTDCINTIETFSSAPPNPAVWTDLVGATISGGKFCITNSGIIGQAKTVLYYSNDFDATIDLEMVNNYSDQGWGCYLEAVTDTNKIIRVGCTYLVGINRALVGSFFGNNGWTYYSAYTYNDFTGLKLKLKRSGDVSSCYTYLPTEGSWRFVGSTTELSTLPVKFRIISDLTPLAYGRVTIAKFDNFTVDKSDADWGINTDYTSSFTCTSGIGPNGWAYYYDMGLQNECNASGYKLPKIYNTQNYPFDEEFAFTFDFTFKTESFIDNSGSVNTLVVSVGVLGHHVFGPVSWGNSWQKFFTGAQIALRRDNIGIGIRNDWLDTSETYVSLNTSAMPYYCRFTSNGEGHYHCVVWTDDFDGVVKVVDFGLDSTVRWQAFKVGVGCGGFTSDYTWGTNGRGKGWVSDFDFRCDKVSHNHIINRSSIRFNGFPGEKLLINYDNSPKCNVAKDCFYFGKKRFEFDFFIKFNKLPANDGDKIYLFKCWGDEQPMTNGASVSSSRCSWAFVIERISGSYRWRFYANMSGTCRLLLDWNFYPDLWRWYHFFLLRGPANTYEVPIEKMSLLRNGHEVLYVGNATIGYDINYSGIDVEVGKNLDGWMEEIRMSCDYSYGGSKVAPSVNQTYFTLIKSVPTRQYERYYTMTIYDSSDNINYGIQMLVDVLFDNNYSYHEPFSVWSTSYYSFFAIDFGQRHDIEIIRSFPVDTAYDFSLTKNILYSNKDVADPSIAFYLTEEERDISDNFEGQDYDYPHNWTKLDTTKATSYIIEGRLYQSAYPTSGQEYARARSNFYFNDDFDFYIDYDLGTSYPMNNIWEARIQIEDIDNDNNKIRFERCYKDGGNQYILWVRDNSSTWTKIMATWCNVNKGTLRMGRANTVFKVYVKDIEDGYDDFVLLSNYQMQNNFGPLTQLNIYTLSDTPSYPHIGVWWDNFTTTLADPMYSTFQDARWMRIKMLNGDGVTRTVKSLGVYPDVSSQRNEAGQYNNYWTPLGTACTSYANAENIALNATISGSSFVGFMKFENAVDGMIPDGDLDRCWGSGEEDHPYFTIHFNQIEPIFSFKVYHGYSISDANNIITDYKIQVSTDGETFSTIFTITGNSSYERTHDLSTPVYVKVVRFYVDAYKAIDRFVWISNEIGYNFWKGAVIREFEIYKYYGFTVINSEDTPIIAIDLQQPFFIEGHSLVGIDTENTEINWDNDSSNFAWSNSNLSDPHKVEFGEWGGAIGFSKWVVIKRNTATHFPLVPDINHPYRDTPDYLKHVVITASSDEVGSKPNPIEYPWMWRSNFSELNYDYNKITYGISCERSLRIDYPASTDSEHIRFIEGDHFGWDDNASWRDGIGTYLYIDDIDNLDLEYGYFYFGGKDYTSQHYPIIHRWNMTTFSGVLKSGWNNINLTFLYADEVIYTELAIVDGRDPRRLYSINWGTIGFIFRGKGKPLQLNFEGMYIERNHFEHGCFPGQQGLYLHGSDIMKIPVGELDFHSGALEFWIRPDWNWDGRDRYHDFKYRTLFHFGNVANDIFGATISAKGLEIYFGNLLNDFNMFIVSGFGFDAIEKVFHMAIVFSSDGTGISSDGSSIRVYINNKLFAKTTTTWRISDDKHFNFVFGGQGLLVEKMQGFDFTSSSVDAVICRLKIHNYCKIDYSDFKTELSENISKALLKPSNFIEISVDNVTYNKVGSSNLPLFFEDVPSGESIPIWVKVLLPKELTGAEKRTAKLLGSWDIGV